jgi:hypothetical protein
LISVTVSPSKQTSSAAWAMLVPSSKAMAIEPVARAENLFICFIVNFSGLSLLVQGKAIYAERWSAGLAEYSRGGSSLPPQENLRYIAISLNLSGAR